MNIGGGEVALIFVLVALAGAFIIALLERRNDKRLRKNNPDMEAACRDRARASREKRREEEEYERHHYEGE